MNAEKVHPDRVFALVADMDGSIRETLSYLFEVVCHRSVHLLSDRTAAARLLDTCPPLEVVVVGCHGVDCGDLELIRTAASMRPRPLVIAVDHESTPKNSVDAFLAGADDVVRLPFSLMEFALRLKVRMKAAGMPCDFDAEGNDDWDTEAHVAHQAGLTTAESLVLRELIRRDGETVTRDELSQAIDHRPWDYGDRKFDVHMASIRRKLGATFGERISVRTIRSAGYQLMVTEAAPVQAGDNQK